MVIQSATLTEKSVKRTLNFESSEDTTMVSDSKKRRTKQTNTSENSVENSNRKRSKKEPKTRAAPPKISLFDKKSEEFKLLKAEIPKTAEYLTADDLSIGAHVSVAGGLHNGLLHAYRLRATSMAFFVTQPRKWTLEKVLSDEDVSIFEEGIKVLGYKLHNIVPHGNYLVNLGSPDSTIYDKSFAVFVTELKICEQLGIPWLNIHPGSATKGSDRGDCLKQIADSINKAHKTTSTVTVVLENMCKQGSTVGGDLLELGTIIEHVDDKTRVGICIDTCHAMAAGYDLSTEEGISDMFKEVNTVGAEYLKAFHLNDKKGKCGDNLDRHQCIGKGCIDLPVFKYLVNKHPKIPMVLETPDGDRWEEELSILRKLRTKK